MYGFVQSLAWNFLFNDIFCFLEVFYKEYGLQNVFGNVVEELTKLTTDGILINVDSTDHQVFFVCGTFLGKKMLEENDWTLTRSNVLLADNKEANTVQGYAKQFNANKYCRFCQMRKIDARKSTTEDSTIRRNRLNYEEDLLKDDLYESGIHEYSPLNNIPFFHVTESSAEDVSHTVEEGIGKYNITEALRILIYEDKLFTLKQLNDRINGTFFAFHTSKNSFHSRSEIVVLMLQLYYFND